MENLKRLYQDEIRTTLQRKFNFSNPMQVPKVLAVTINMGVGRQVVANSKFIDFAVEQMSLIAAQKPVVTTAKKSNAGFKIRKDMPLGCKVTLRGNQMYNFLQRLVLIALPRQRDFRGFSKKSFDGKGNFSFGIREHSIFPEIDYGKIERAIGLDINIITSAKTDEEAKELLVAFNFPFVD